MEKNFDKIILKPIISEKSTALKDIGNIYCFEVHPDATKLDIKQVIQKVYEVHVEKVNVVNIKGKKKRRRFREGKRKDWKKAYIKLKKGEKIENIEGV